MYDLAIDILPELNALATGWSSSWSFLLASSALFFLGLALLDPPGTPSRDTNRGHIRRDAA